MNLNVACVQVNASDNIDENIRISIEYIRKAAEQGADLIALPENVECISSGYSQLLSLAKVQDEHEGLKLLQNTAKELKKFLLIGSLSIKLNNEDKIANRSFFIDNKGDIIASYDKIHLFDTDVKGGESHNESQKVLAGKKISIANSPWGEVGMTICYDLRFPHLYRKLAQKGARIITVPAAFTEFTGKAHWHILLRARAIETGCFIIAPAQTGTHISGRKTYGHSLIVDPWGNILADGGEKPGIAMAALNMSKVDEVREQIPSLFLEKEF